MLCSGVKLVTDESMNGRTDSKWKMGIRQKLTTNKIWKICEHLHVYVVIFVSSLSASFSTRLPAQFSNGKTLIDINLAAHYFISSPIIEAGIVQ